MMEIGTIKVIREITGVTDQQGANNIDREEAVTIQAEVVTAEKVHNLTADDYIFESNSRFQKFL